jgi:hypothetical protein
MNRPPIDPRFQTEEFRKYLLNKQGKGPLFSFLLTSAIVFLVFLVSVLKPHRLYKKFISFLFGVSITINNSKYKLKHLLLLITGFYGTLYFFLLMQGRQFYPSPNDKYGQKMAKLDRKWVLESQSWLAFLIIICLLSIYRNSQLFSQEKKLDETNNELDKNKTKKNE